MLDRVFPLFQSKNICFIIDRDDIFLYLVDKGYNVIRYSENMVFPENSINVQTSINHYELIDKQIKKLDNQKSRVLRLPQIIFDSSYENFLYTLEKISTCNFVSMFKLKDKLIKKLKSLDKILIRTGKQYTISCTFDKGIQYKYPSQILLDYGKPRSIAEYLEISFDYNPTISSDFYLNGTFCFTGSVFAVLPRKSITKNQIEQARFLFQKILTAKQCILEIENSYAVSLKIDTIEYVSLLLEIVGQKLKLRVTELAFGLNKSNDINWSYNSQFNEGCLGVHIGFGDAISGVHIDFVSPHDDILDIIS
jgi:hypothetical protein